MRLNSEAELTPATVLQHRNSNRYIEPTPFRITRSSGMNTTVPLPTKRKYSAKWQERFDFFEAHGAPKDPSFNTAFKALPGFGKKMLMQMNFIAFFFGPIYLFVPVCGRKISLYWAF